MGGHKFRVGQTVRFLQSTENRVFGGTPPGNFRIVGLMPEAQGHNQYRVESTSDGHNRMALEKEISPL